MVRSRIRQWAAAGVPVVAGMVLAAGMPATAAPGAPGERPALCGHDQRSGSAAVYACAEEGDLLEVRLGDLHPTQPAIGYDQIYYKLGRYTLGKDDVNKRFDDWCEANGQGGVEDAEPDATLADPSTFDCEVEIGDETDAELDAMKTLVVGPGGVPYLTDGHHTFTSLLEVAGPDVRVRVRVQDNLSTLPTSRFWERMEADDRVWLRDADGSTVEPTDLPGRLGLDTMNDDELRGLVYFTKDIGYASPEALYAQFRWGNWITGNPEIDLSEWDRGDVESYLAAVRAVSEAQTALDADDVVDGGYTAAELGALEEWNDGDAADDGEFAKLARPYSDDKPGKLAYAMEYKKEHGLE
ncbi:chromosome partitioning protein ParB [Streptomyces regensis]|uniref:Putative ParB-like nuclease n=2 Tax=Prauserella rugosa TaxID=43354 RepID=A0A660CEM9_9PSEU|nr:ParB/Srx family N-terminal domain-containing protein [Prauserella rugosa]KMS82251.1 chromosome partitioning protein ParB [Streptomyces regensis]TWH20153.1 putative ParB-like nuclease [Prauserella rugosa]